MDRAEKLMKQYLKSNLALDKDVRSGGCLSEQVLWDYLTSGLDEQRCQEVEHHIAACGFCLSQLSIAYEAQRFNKQKGVKSVSSGLLAKTKAALGITKQDEGAMSNRGKKTKRRLFLAATVIFFILSFIIPRYFLQFLVASLILGIRWSFESESGHTMIMILDSWRRHSHDKDDDISRRLKNRF